MHQHPPQAPLSPNKASMSDHLEAVAGYHLKTDDLGVSLAIPVAAHTGFRLALTGGEA